MRALTPLWLSKSCCYRIAAAVHSPCIHCAATCATASTGVFSAGAFEALPFIFSVHVCHAACSFLLKCLSWEQKGCVIENMLFPPADGQGSEHKGTQVGQACFLFLALHSTCRHLKCEVFLHSSLPSLAWSKPIAFDFVMNVPLQDSGACLQFSSG